ncbi:hypothetical protein ASO20_00155 [Mycoplasma sp. (ex Biomphalaria glabrata)]|uniref:RsmE family RNA methyltransferase n=1 Tax=Mycoplasma sp. (ex Biomphalaria glabrata) TaxID=1749074 RepID=UPI00073A5AAD|nr:RsmE family RNA methyltransferase [Mycoplasma sp. (ex Biomphalaria glabrata)]ALV23093.1 hypothetical protein ASO20_00155 [Mycoplasma sp. (ex Biomphalaria glabrata)]
MQKYFLNHIENNNFYLRDNDFHHAKNVMRFKINEEIMIIFNNRKILTKLVAINKDNCKLEIIQELDEDTELPIKISVAIGLTRNEKMDLIIQKLTELGCHEITPILMTRSIVNKIDDTKIERWSKIAKEAAEQSNRNTMPIITPIQKLSDWVKNKEGYYCYELADTDNQLKLDNFKQENFNYFLIGPEGGIDLREVEILQKAQWKPISLGKRILRMETATFYLMSVISFLIEKK